MSTETPAVLHRLPQYGWISETDMAAALDLHEKHFRELVKKYKIQMRQFGSSYFLRAEQFFESLPLAFSEQETPPNGKEKKRTRT
jgi:hypothetical protein